MKKHPKKTNLRGVVLALAALCGNSITQAAPFTWTQASATANDWTTATNWLNSTPYVSDPANELILYANTTTALSAGVINVTVNVPTTLSLNTLTLNGRATAATTVNTTVNIGNAASAWTIGNGTTSLINLNGINNLSNGTAWSGMLFNANVAANITLNQASTTVTGSGTGEFVISGNITEAAAGYGLSKSGTSTLALSGTNTYTGQSTISAGGLVFRKLSAKSSATHTFAAGTTLGLGVGAEGFFTSSDLDMAFANTMTGNLAALVRDTATNIGIDTSAGDFTYSSSVAGSPASGLVKLGANKLTLSGLNTYTEPTVITRGVLEVDTLANGGMASNIGAGAAGAAGMIIDGGTLRYTGATTTTDRGFLHNGNPNATIQVSQENVSLTLGAWSILNNQALNITGATGSSLALGPLTATSTAGQGNFTVGIPTTIQSINYSITSSQFVVANRGTALLRVGNITGPGTTQALFLGGASTVFDGVIGGFSGNCIIGAGGAVITLTGDNTFTGRVDMRQAGTVLAFDSIKNVGAGASALGAPVTATNGTILFGQIGNSMTLRYIGTGDTTDRVLHLNGTGGTVTLEQAGSGLLKFTSNLTSAAGAKTLALAGSTTGVGEISGAIVDNSSANKTSLAKNGTGTWILSGANTYTGATTVNAGTLALSGGSLTSAISVTATGTLGFTLGSPITSTSTVNFATDSQVAITGTISSPNNYLLMTASGGISGAPKIIPETAGYSVQIRNSGTELWLEYNPNIQTHVIDFTSGTTIVGGTFGTYSPNPLGLPLPNLPAGTILKSLSINSTMTATDNGNFAADLSLLFDPTPLTPGGDFLLAITTTDDGDNFFNATNRISWPENANAGVGTALIDFKSSSSWAAAGGIDLSTTGIFLGNSFGTTAAGATWTGTITLTYELPATGYNLWSAGALASADTNGDGVKNAIAWVLGASSPAANATALLPILDNTSDPDFVIFAFRRIDTTSTDSKATTKVQYGTSLSSWTDATPSSDVIITPSDDFYGAGVDKVEVKMRRTLAVGGKLFARLHVVIAP